MNGPHLHLLINHFPIVGTVVGILVLATGLILKNVSIRRIAMVIFAGAAITGAMAWFTGEGAEEGIEHLPGVDEGFIEAHEEAAGTYFIVCIALGLVATATLLLDALKNKLQPVLYPAVLIFALASMYFAVEAGNSGGEIRHPEVRAGAAAPAGEAEQGDDD